MCQPPANVLDFLFAELVTALDGRPCPVRNSPVSHSVRCGAFGASRDALLLAKCGDYFVFMMKGPELSSE